MEHTMVMHEDRTAHSARGAHQPVTALRGAGADARLCRSVIAPSIPSTSLGHPRLCDVSACHLGSIPDPPLKAMAGGGQAPPSAVDPTTRLWWPSAKPPQQDSVRRTIPSENRPRVSVVEVSSSRRRGTSNEVPAAVRLLSTARRLYGGPRNDATAFLPSSDGPCPSAGAVSCKTPGEAVRWPALRRPGIQDWPIVLARRAARAAFVFGALGGGFRRYQMIPFRPFFLLSDSRERTASVLSPVRRWMFGPSSVRRVVSYCPMAEVAGGSLRRL